MRWAADAGAAKVKKDGHADAFVERLFERDQSAVERKLAQAAADLTPVFEQHQGKDGPAELNAQFSLPFLRDGG